MDLRLLNLILVLERHPQGISSEEIYQSVEQYRRMSAVLFRRTLIRDIYSLEQMGININRLKKEEHERGKIYQLS
jgi:predicted DNA-binding transcriptional regulator YafY